MEGDAVAAEKKGEEEEGFWMVVAAKQVVLSRALKSTLSIDSSLRKVNIERGEAGGLVTNSQSTLSILTLVYVLTHIYRSILTL